MREATSIIEDDLLSAVAEGLTSVQHVDSYNRGFTSLRDMFCLLVTKEIRVRDDAEWYGHRVVSLRREWRRSERRWRRIGSDASDFSGFFFFLEKIIRFGSEIDTSVVNQEFSIDFPLRFPRSFTFSHFILVTEADVLGYIRETRKTCRSLDPISISKLGEAYESATPAVGAIINSSFDEGHFVATEKCGLIQPYLKKIGLDINDLSNYHSVTNLTHLSKIIERAMLD